MYKSNTLQAALLLPLLASSGNAAAQTIQDDIALFDAPPQAIPANINLPATPTLQHISLSAQPLLVTQSPGGVTLRENVKNLGAGGHSMGTNPGAPDISRRVVDVLLPWDANLNTLKIQITSQNTTSAGTFTNVLPTGGLATTNPQTQGAQPITIPGLVLDGQGRDVSIYGSNSSFPLRPVEIIGVGEMRQYRYVRLSYAPYLWAPATGVLTKVNNVQFDLSWERAQIDVNATKFDLSDPVVMVEDMADRFINLSPATSWYLLTSAFRRTGTYDFVIITKQATRMGSTELSNFVTHKQAEGYDPIVISIEGIDAYYSGSERADRMRAFLEDKYSDWGIEHVLLIGGPDPDDNTSSTDSVGSVPMKMTWPSGDGVGSGPTDHFYGDLSGDWDVDGDGYFASWYDDKTTRTYHYDSGGMDYTLTYTDFGIDFDMECRVGRISSDDVGVIDPILSRTIHYEDATPSNETDRKRVYLAMSNLDSSTDMSYLGRDIHNDHLTGIGLSVNTLYIPTSPFSHTIDLESEALIDTWTSRGAGMVIWAAHGSSTGATITYDSTSMMNTVDSVGLDFSPRPFVMQASCSNAYPETAGNLAHSLLEDGVMATIAASRTAIYLVGQTNFGSNVYIGDVAYWVAESYAANNRAGYAIKYYRAEIDATKNWWGMKNALVFNLYGDPTVRFEW